ncbi:hypothetical protein ACIBF1_21665 [Spirillospora sp. NPDC050679]
MAKDEFNDNTGTVHRGKGDINQNSGTSSRRFSGDGVTCTNTGGISRYFSKKK